MFSKIVCLTALVAVAYAQHHGQQHGHAYSSQSFVLHQEPSHQQQQHASIQHAAPIHQQQQHAPIQHAAPIHQQQQHAPIQHAAPIHQAAPAHHNEHHEEHYYSYPKYEYVYNVEDKHSGDIKSAQESRDGDVVKGEYSLHQPDGRIRTVKYTADKHSGFNAEVHYSGEAKHSEPQQQQQHQYHH